MKAISPPASVVVIMTWLSQSLIFLELRDFVCGNRKKPKLIKNVR